MKETVLLLLPLIVLASVLYSGPARSGVFPGATWQTKAPTEVGLDAAKLADFSSHVGGRGCVTRHGYMAYTWGDHTKRGDVASAAKPWYSTFLFKAVEDGRLASLDAKANAYEPRLNDINASLGYKDRNITFRHLANQTSCYGVRENPGAAFDYNDWQMALFWDALFLKVYGATYDDVDTKVLHPMLTDILQCEDAPTFMAFGTSDRAGRTAVSPRDFCRFGLLYLNGGNWNGTRVLSEAHAATAVSSPLPNSIPRTAGQQAEMISGQRSIGSTRIPDDQTDHMGSYSWLWWTNGVDRNGDRHWPDAPADTHGCFGHGGKRAMAVMPGLDIVLSWNDSAIDSAAKGNEAFKRLVGAVKAPSAGPVDGQIVVDPGHPARMVYHNTYVGGRLKPVILCGPGDPEDFFYNNTTQNRDFLVSKGARCTYITAYLKDFGGGSPGTGAALDSTLNTWEGLITDLEDAGIVTVFFFFDDTQGLPSGWETAVDKIVNRFEHHRLLVWSVAEEYSEAMTKSDVAAVAARIKAADDHEHVVGVHQLSGTSFDFNGYSDLEMFLMQLGDSPPASIHGNLLSAWTDTGGEKILNMAEMANHAEKDRTTVRRVNWAAVMGGASAVQILRMGRATDAAAWNEQGKYGDCAVLMDFFESTDVNSMTPNDGLAHGGTQWVLANPGQSYVAYASSLSGAIGLKNVTAGTYDFEWVDCVTGKTVSQADVPVSAGEGTWPRPADIGTELAVWIRRTGAGTGNDAPVAEDKSVSTVEDTPVEIRLGFTDPDGPGPHVISAGQPGHGRVSVDGDSCIYTPDSGYFGGDSFTYKVNDGLSDSAAATVTIEVYEDSDGDGLPNWWETQYGLDPQRADTDGDGIDDGDEDDDADGRTNLAEYASGSDPLASDAVSGTGPFACASGGNARVSWMAALLLLVAPALRRAGMPAA